jgi:hypothetical protein
MPHIGHISGKQFFIYVAVALTASCSSAGSGLTPARNQGAPPDTFATVDSSCKKHSIGGAVKIIAAVEDPVAIRKILDHLDQQGAMPQAYHRPAVRAPRSANTADGSGPALMTIQKRYPIRTAGWPGSVRLDVRKVARSMALG